MVAKKTPKKAKKGKGRPSLYMPEYAEQARKLCLLGATDKQLADFFGVSEQTLNVWKGKHPDFVESLRAGKIKADAEVASKLYDRAIGAEWTEQQAFKVKRGTNHEEVIVVDVKKAAPPDTPAIGLWLHNRKSDLWRKNPEPSSEEDKAQPVQVVVNVVDASVKRDADQSEA